MSKIIVIGIDSFGLTLRKNEILTDCTLVVAGNRLLAEVTNPEVEKRSITPLADAMAAIRQALPSGNVGVLASGDPLFFGIGRRLLAEFDSSRVEFFPALSSMQEACARFKLSWDDAELISLHGRKNLHVPGLLLRYPKSLIFTDQAHTPDILARELISYCETIGEGNLPDECRMMVAENIGNDKERVTEGSLHTVASRSFADLNVLCILVPEDGRRGRLGLTENEIAHSRGLITKDEVRAATLHKLRLPKSGVFWDIGAGSGSVSVEAALMNPDLTVYSVERKKEELANIKENICRNRCYNVVPVSGEAPFSIENLPDPDAVFIGGSGGQLEKIIAEAAKRLPNGGRLVVNGVIEKTVTEAPRFMKDNGLSVESSTVQISRTGQADEPVVFNPITIMVGSK